MCNYVKRAELGLKATGQTFAKQILNNSVLEKKTTASSYCLNANTYLQHTSEEPNSAGTVSRERKGVNDSTKYMRKQHVLSNKMTGRQLRSDLSFALAHSHWKMMFNVVLPLSCFIAKGKTGQFPRPFLLSHQSFNLMYFVRIICNSLLAIRKPQSHSSPAST